MASIEKLKLENKKLKRELQRYEILAASALTDYQNKTLLEDRHKAAVAEIKALESKTRSIAQKIRREEERQEKLQAQLESTKAKLVDKWGAVFNGKEKEKDN